MSTALTAGQAAQLRTELELRRHRLSRQLGEHLHGQTLAERAHEVAQQDADDAPQRQPERDVAVALTNLERRELDAVVQAQARMDAGRYGRCARCGNDIPFDRLRVEPWALHCVGCAA
ncbi:MAG: TraR/DksA family transcriptional regulator [Rubrivivax sp.]|jgi:RNA polymerase-binding transcription factor DksA